MTNSDLINQLGLRIREARRKAKMNGQELAARIGMSQSYISEIERGNRSPALSTLAAIAEALGKPISYFFPDVVEDKPQIEGQFPYDLSELDRSFGDLVLRKMREKDISLEQLSKDSGVSTANLRRILEGFIPNRPVVLRLASVLDTNPNLFLIAAGYIPREMTHHLLRLLADRRLQQIIQKIYAEFPTDEDKDTVLRLLDQSLQHAQAQ